jgi:hypothetical protein
VLVLEQHVPLHRLCGAQPVSGGAQGVVHLLCILRSQNASSLVYAPGKDTTVQRSDQCPDDCTESEDKPCYLKSYRRGSWRCSLPPPCFTPRQKVPTFRKHAFQERRGGKKGSDDMRPRCKSNLEPGHPIPSTMPMGFDSQLVCRAPFFCRSGIAPIATASLPNFSGGLLLIYRGGRLVITLGLSPQGTRRWPKRIQLRVTGSVLLQVCCCNIIVREHMCAPMCAVALRSNGQSATQRMRGWPNGSIGGRLRDGESAAAAADRLWLVLYVCPLCAVQYM